MRRQLLVALALLVASHAHAQDSRPNVVVLLADDLGVGDLGCYGQTRIRTPRIDALAAEGVRMEHAYSAAPVCAPSRCALMTGMHTGHCTVDHNDEPNLPLGLADPTLAEVLRREGYRTGIVGKWGLGGETDDGVAFGTFSMPGDMGFDHVLAVLDQARAQDHYPERVLAGEAWRVVPGNADGAEHTLDEDLFVDDALAFVRASDARPFFLYFASTFPHRGLVTLGDAHADEGWPEPERAYATMVERFDTDVGRIVDAIDALDRDTIVIVASDNGPVTVDGHVTGFFGSAMGLRGQKRDLYEGGLHVPLVVRWRGHLDPRASSTPVALYDLFPTITDLVHVPAPTGMDGLPIGAWLRGERDDDVHARFFFSAREANGGSEPASRFLLREGPLALIERADGARELYDVVDDPAQSEDLAAVRADDVTRLHAAVLEEASGPIARAFPQLEIRDVEGDVIVTAESAECMRVLDLAAGEPLSSDAPVQLAIVGHGVTSDADAIELPSSGYLTIGAHPALSFGESSFTLVSRVRLDHVVEGPTATREARRYLALSKPMAMRDELLDWGVLVQAGDLGATGHELAVLFADPDVGGHGTWALVTHRLAITDGAFHDVAVRYDAPARVVHVVLDGDEETIAIDHDWGHVRSDAPLVVGAHHDVHGNFDGFLDGAIARFELARGLGSNEGCPTLVSERTMDLGEIATGSETVRRLEIANVAAAPAMALDVTDVAIETQRDRLAVDFSAERTLTPDAAPIPVVLRVRTDAPGPIAATLVVRGGPSHVADVVLARIAVTGSIIAPIAPTRRGPPEWLPFVAAAFIAAGIRFLLWDRQRRKK